MTEIETVDLLCELLYTGEPFVHVRFGDGDVMFATGTGSKITGDGEEWCQELADVLLLAWRSLAVPKHLLLGDLRTYAVSDGVEEQWDDLLEELHRQRSAPYTFVHMEALRVGFGHALPFYEAVRSDERSKVFVGPIRLRPISKRLGCDHLSVPLHVAWEFGTVASTIGSIIGNQYEVALFAAGRGGKIMQAQLGMVAPDLTQIDVGSGVDLLIDDGVRRGTDMHVSRTKIMEKYRAVGLCP
ncbi:MAG TPA: hypothetical protein VGF24_37420 [Vicinamibacterales bacterium]